MSVFSIWLRITTNARSISRAAGVGESVGRYLVHISPQLTSTNRLHFYPHVQHPSARNRFTRYRSRTGTKYGQLIFDRNLCFRRSRLPVFGADITVPQIAQGPTVEIRVTPEFVAIEGDVPITINEFM